MTNTIHAGRPQTMVKHRILTPGAIIRALDEFTTVDITEVEKDVDACNGFCFVWEDGNHMIGKFVKQINALQPSHKQFTFRRLK